MASIGIRIRWQDNNDFEGGFRIYRKETAFTKDSLPPEPLVELPPNTTVYIDETALPESTYHYLISTFAGNVEEFAQKSVQASNHVGPLSLGELYQGGYYIGNISVTSGENEGTYAILMAPEAAEASIAWKSERTSTSNTSSTTNGLANTLAQLGQGSHPAAEHCAAYRGGDYEDWYLPARGELHLAYLNISALGALALSSSYYWSSTQSSANSAWSENVSNGTQNSSIKTNAYLVRPVRRIRIS